MYLRFGWVVGNVGLVGTLIIVTISTAITFLTSLSIASIATNAPVKAGGAYYMISRSLGAEIGGAIGVPLYLAQAFSVALYVIGFSESLAALYPTLNIKIIGVITTLALGALALFSTKAAIRAQYVILAVIILSLVSLVLGSPLENSQIEMWGAAPENSTGFWKVFAVFFPAVTGIMAGVNLSGDLKDPARSIPRGTFLAVGVGYLVYMTLPLLLASRADAITLVENPLIMRDIAIFGFAIILGVWGASLSSAVGSLLGAPRILQALAADGLLPRPLSFFKKGIGPEKIPRAGTILTMMITLASVLLGNLNIIAPILTMFFLTTYGVLNITSGIERFLGSPSFRPKFKVHWIFSLIGAAGCMAIMFLINALATLAAIIFILSVFLWLKRRGLRTAMGGVKRGLLVSLVRYATLRLDKDTNAKSWRPNILVLSGAPTRRWHLIELANVLTQGKALFTVATVVSEKQVPLEKISSFERQISDYIHGKKINALVRVTRAKDPFTGAQEMINSYGLGPLIPNTILLGDTQEPHNHQKYVNMISHAYHSRRNVIIMQNVEGNNLKPGQNIDVWWGGLKGNGALMMVLAYLVRSSELWQGVKITVKMMVTNEKAAEKARINLREILAKIRVDFNTKILVNEAHEFWNLLNRESQHADLVMLGLAPPSENFLEYYNNLKENTKNLPTKLFVLAAGEVDFNDILS